MGLSVSSLEVQWVVATRFRYFLAWIASFVLVFTPVLRSANAGLCSAKEVALLAQQYTDLIEDMAAPAARWEVDAHSLDRDHTILVYGPAPARRRYVVRRPTPDQRSWTAEQLLNHIQSSERWFRALGLYASGTFSIRELDSAPGLVAEITGALSPGRPPHTVQYWQPGQVGIDFLTFEKPEWLDLAASLDSLGVEFLPESRDGIPDPTVVASLAAEMRLPGIDPAAEVLRALDQNDDHPNHRANFVGFSRWMSQHIGNDRLLEQLGEHWLARGALDGGWDMQVNYLIAPDGSVRSYDTDAAFPDDANHLELIPWRTNPLLVEPGYHVELANDVLISFVSDDFLRRFQARTAQLQQILLTPSAPEAVLGREQTAARIRDRVELLVERTREAQQWRREWVLAPTP